MKRKPRYCKHRAVVLVHKEYMPAAHGHVWRDVECPNCGELGRIRAGFTHVEWGPPPPKRTRKKKGLFDDL